MTPSCTACGPWWDFSSVSLAAANPRSAITCSMRAHKSPSLARPIALRDAAPPSTRLSLRTTDRLSTP
eukprot:9929623-Alexandrium_andersonii.AAC.1